MQQENQRNEEQTDYPKTQPQDAASMDSSQQGTRQHGNAGGDREGWSDQVGGDPNQRGTHGHPADEHLHHGMSGDLGRQVDDHPGSHGEFDQQVSGGRVTVGEGSDDRERQRSESDGPF